MNRKDNKEVSLLERTLYAPTFQLFRNPVEEFKTTAVIERSVVVVVLNELEKKKINLYFQGRKRQFVLLSDVKKHFGEVKK